MSIPIAISSVSELLTMVDGLQISKYLAVASFALLVYDYFLTLEQEVRSFDPFGRSLG